MIDVLLREQGWQVEDRTKVILEVDTKQSDFKAQDYKNVTETLKNDFESRFADYLLLDSHGSPIAIVEAKRTSKDPILGQKQAEQYADDIKAQIGKDVFIFLSNGYEIRFWDRERYGPREVKGFFSQKDLERLRFQVENAQDLSGVGIDTGIVDRPKSIEITKRVIEHIQRGNRKALVVMATGTGKTRIAMAIIDILLKANWAQKVLFLADRKALRDQADDKGFKKFHLEESQLLLDELVDLMKYMAPEPRETIVIDMDGVIQERKVITFGLHEFPDSEMRIDEAFRDYIRANNKHYNAGQLNFIRAIQSVFAKKKHFEYAELFDPPFSNFRAGAPMPLFDEDELEGFIGICASLERELFAEA